MPASFRGPQALSRCPGCSAWQVQRVTAYVVGRGLWALTLRCASCPTSWDGVFEQSDVDRFSATSARQWLALRLERSRIDADNTAEWAERFIVALEHDAILPEDF